MTGISAISTDYNGCTQENFSVAISSTTNRITSTGYCYDAAGNLLGQSDCYTYEYDAENRLVATAGVDYTYDGDGKRVKKDQSGGSTYDQLYWYVGLNPLVETDLSGNNPVEYIFMGSKKIAARASSGSVIYYFADHLGTSRVVTNASGTILDDSDFYPFGGERVVSASSGNRYKFTGKERDGESGLDISARDTVEAIS